MLIGAITGLGLYVVMRARSLEGPLGEREAPDVLGLPPERALTVLGALMNKGDALSSPLLSALAEVRTRAESDLEGAIERALTLASQHPRSPAVQAELARLHARRGDEKACAGATARAIELSLRGGMNGLAARTFEDLSPEWRDGLELSRDDLQALERALAARGCEQERAWVAARTRRF